MAKIIDTAMTNIEAVSIATISIRSSVEDIVDQKFQKAWRLIKKTRWQGHYNTRKRSRRF